MYSYEVVQWLKEHPFKNEVMPFSFKSMLLDNHLTI